MAVMIECRALSKSFRGIKALDKLNLTINSGTTNGLVGPNGAGKSTLFSILSGFLYATSGTVHLWGHSPDKMDLKGRIGILPQDTPFLKGISIQSQLTLFARLQGLNKYEAINETSRVLEKTNVSNLAKQYPETLSFGQRKRVTIAQALIGNPELILFDEPTSGLDPVAANEVRSLIKRLSSDVSFIISSHNLNEIENVCDQIILIDKGKIIKHCSITELTEQENCLALQLDQNVTSEIMEKLTVLPEIDRTDPDPDNSKRLLIYFSKNMPDDVLIKILEILQRHGIGIHTFNRGTALSDKVVNLVRRTGPG